MHRLKEQRQRAGAQQKDFPQIIANRRYTREMSWLHKPEALAFALTALFVSGLVAYRLLWLASQLAAGAALGRFPRRVTAGLRRWRLG